MEHFLIMKVWKHYLQVISWGVGNSTFDWIRITWVLSDWVMLCKTLFFCFFLFAFRFVSVHFQLSGWWELHHDAEHSDWLRYLFSGREVEWNQAFTVSILQPVPACKLLPLSLHFIPELSIWLQETDTSILNSLYWNITHKRPTRNGLCKIRF